MNVFVRALSVTAISWLSFSASAAEAASGSNEYVFRQNVDGMVSKPKEKPFYVSCKDIKQTNPDSKSGTYLLEPKGEGTGGYRLYCDMKTDGGGWTLVFKQSNFESQAATDLASNTSVLGDLSYDNGKSSFGNLSSLFSHTESLIYSDANNYFIMNMDFAGLAKTPCDNPGYRCTNIAKNMKLKVGLPAIDSSTTFSFGYYHAQLSGLMMGRHPSMPWGDPVHGRYHYSAGLGNWVMMVR